MALDTVPALTEEMRRRMGPATTLKGTVKFDFGTDGIIFVDGTAKPTVVNNDDQPADCTLTLSLKTMKDMVNGKINGTMAYMTGKLKISGKKELAMKIEQILEE